MVNKKYNEEEMNTGHIVADCDEVLVNISPKIVQLMHEDYDYYNKYFRLSKDFDLNKHESTVLSRPSFQLDQWLVRPDVYDNYSEDEVNEARLRLMNELIHSPTLYDDLEPTNLGRGLSLTAATPLLKKLSIVTRTSDRNLESKEKFLKTLFQGNMDKVDIYYIEGNDKKSDVLSTLGYITKYYEDEIKNIEDVVTNCDNFSDTSIDIPSFGYNQDISNELINKCRNKNINMNYYSFMGN